MILIVSGRTDIIAFYSKWFLNRIKAGFVDVRNPFNKDHVSRINFKNVDAYMFCTKNPLPIISHLKEFTKPILFHITITPYKKDIEPNVIDKTKIIDGVKEIAKIIGKENVYIRYDPIFINDTYTLDYHIRAFKKLASSLKGYIAGFIISFLDDYKNVQKNYHVLRPKIWTKEDYQKLGTSFSKIASENGVTIQTCAEEINLVEYGFKKGECLSKELAKRLTGKTKFKKWSARKSKTCNCVEMVDIGAYNTCTHFCKYCYANFDEDKIIENIKNHNDESTLLVGDLKETDKIIERKE